LTWIKPPLRRGGILLPNMTIKIRGATMPGAADRHPPFEIDVDLIRRLDRNGPRYTSYPTADRFVETFGPEAYASAVARRNIGGIRRALSLYVHLPFCNTLCFYCACNKIATKDRNKGRRYLEYLLREIDLQSPLFGTDRRVEQMHWGGGTPTFHDTDDLARRAVIQRLMCDFALSRQNIEISYLLVFNEYFRQELEELKALEQAGLVALEDDWITVTPKGRMLVRTICMVFDAYLRKARETRRYSRVI
jgi:coproporphyrinogen III oxidase-like Fe-S oxidoreductase